MVCAFIVGLEAGSAHAVVEMEGWGDLRGVRIDGQLMRITTSLHAIRPGRTQFAATGPWQTKDIQFTRDRESQIYRGKIGFADGQELSYRYTIRDQPQDSVEIQIQARPLADMDLEELSFRVAAPLDDYRGGGVELIDPKMPTTQSSTVCTTQPTNRQYLDGVASGIRFIGARHRLEADFETPRRVVVQDLANARGEKVFAEIELHPGSVKKDQLVEATLTIHTSGEVDHEPAHVTLKPADGGRPFDGIGGNFVFNLDAPVVKFNLEHLRVAWARLAIPLSAWEPREVADPTSGELDQNDRPGSEIRSSLELARVLHQRGIPLIFSVWIAPGWAESNPDPAEPYGNGRLVIPEKWDALCRSIASYLLYARRQYGVEPQLFSFNESDLGVTIKLTPEDHRDAIKRLGATFASAGLKTRLLLGDVSYPGPVDFISATVKDPEAMQYVGAISYHSWSGAAPAKLAAWHTAAAAANVPLLVDEGGTDAEAYFYPFIFDETWYAMEEGALYLDILSNSQPLTIMPWELTSDYPLAVPKGSDLVPSKRFWLLKQLSTAIGPGAIHQEIASDNGMIHAAAFSDAIGHEYSIQLVNTGASRQVTISGIPATVQRLDCYLTDAHQSFQKTVPLVVQDGSAHLELPALCSISLTNRRIPPTDAN